ncbi:MAG: hypothetical protein ABIH82_01185 [Candidatus Woesearchaeota archaeon]
MNMSEEWRRQDPEQVLREIKEQYKSPLVLVVTAKEQDHQHLTSDDFKQLGYELRRGFDLTGGRILSVGLHNWVTDIYSGVIDYCQRADMDDNLGDLKTLISVASTNPRSIPSIPMDLRPRRDDLFTVIMSENYRNDYAGGEALRDSMVRSNLSAGRPQSFDYRILPGDRKKLGAYALGLADMVVAVDGNGAMLKYLIAALKRGKPVIPIPSTGGKSALLSDVARSTSQKANELLASDRVTLSEKERSLIFPTDYRALGIRLQEVSQQPLLLTEVVHDPATQEPILLTNRISPIPLTRKIE